MTWVPPFLPPGGGGTDGGVGGFGGMGGTFAMICVPGMRDRGASAMVGVTPPTPRVVPLGTAGLGAGGAPSRSEFGPWARFAARAASVAASSAERSAAEALAASGETGAGAGEGSPTRMLFAGKAVSANGLTEFGPCGRGMLGVLVVDATGLGPTPGLLGKGTGAGADAPSLGSPAGAPQAAQNFRKPMSSAPHFAQWVMGIS